MSAKQPFNRVLTGEDSAVAFYAKLVGNQTAAGAAITTATLQSVSASDYVEFLINAAGDAGINDYTGAAGAAGRITYTDANANSIQEVIDIINGVGAGQDGSNKRWRAALGDVPGLYALTAGDLLNQGAAVQAMLGRESIGAAVNLDHSALASADIWVGIGTERGCIKGSGLVFPDFFEDIPPDDLTVSDTSFGRGTRGKAKILRNSEAGAVTRKRVVIEYIRSNAAFATSNTLTIWNEDQNPASDTPLWQESLGTAAATSAVFTGLSNGGKFYGPPGKRLFVRFRGVGALTAGSVIVRGYYESGPFSE